MKNRTEKAEIRTTQTVVENPNVSSNQISNMTGTLGATSVSKY